MSVVVTLNTDIEASILSGENKEMNFFTIQDFHLQGDDWIFSPVREGESGKYPITYT
ncbi:MAG: hypothetical protein F6K10_30275 [Moorea sp. SIO2B7]|nr:hypothetical protein [Moorena sp. SIO2B7]